MIVTCPECKQKLRLSADVPAGKRIKCPKCAGVFSAADDSAEEAAPPRKDAITRSPSSKDAVTRSSPKPAKPTRPEPDVEEDEDELPRKSKRRSRDEDDDVDEDAPRARSKRRELDEEDDEDDERPAKKRRRKRAKKGNAAVLWGAIGGGGGLVAIVVTVLLLVLRSGGSGQQEQAIKEMIQIMREFRQTLESVKDQNSAKTAAGQLDALCVRMEDLGKRAKALPKVTKAESDRLEAKYKPEMKQLEQGMQQVGFQAGMNSGNEPTFIAALQKFAQTATRVGTALK